MHAAVNKSFKPCRVTTVGLLPDDNADDDGDRRDADDDDRDNGDGGNGGYGDDDGDGGSGGVGDDRLGHAHMVAVYGTVSCIRSYTLLNDSMADELAMSASQ
eukprot:GHVU01075449.1.p1 GENE.GHVU01075449.1~~GHVU01075449.1.p1  ORF type:complete len:102 (-),score=8.90 GHVU01075449.1:420-725(-)